MQNKILLSFLIIGLVFSLQAGAVMKSNDGNADKVQEQMQTANQGNDIQIQVENNESEQNGNENGMEQENGDQVQEQERIQERLQIQNQNGNQEQVKNQERNGEVNGASHRSAVANFVQELLSVADREGGRIGQEIREIAQQQNETKEKVAEAIDTIKNQNIIKTFLVGPDYKSTLRLKAEISAVESQIVELNNLIEESISKESEAEVQSQIEVLEQAKENISNFLETNKNQFNLFGWFLKLFVKTEY
jgi:DNA-binding Lrp family transcriptional regulator